MRSLPLLLALLLAPSALAQNGALDQVSEMTNASFDLSHPALIWQQEVRVGITGRLEGFEMTLTGPVHAGLHVRVRLGEGWTTSDVVWEGFYSKSAAGTEMPFFDVSSASLPFQAGESFVIEAQGNGTGAHLLGSYADPDLGGSLYPGELYLGGPSCFENCGWRHGFRTWMFDGYLGERYCTAVTNSTGAPALIHATGSMSIANNNLILTAGPVPSQPGLFYYGPLQTIVPFGNGFRCVTGTVGRLPITSPAGGVLTHPVDYTQPPSAATVITVGSTWNFQAWYRDPAAGIFGFNLSDALEISFGP